MRFGWRWLIPISLVWIVLVATFNLGRQQGWFSTGTFWIIAVVIFAVLLGLSFFGGGKEPGKEEGEPLPEAFDAFAGGYPVPPMPGQVLPELAGVLTGAAEEGMEASAQSPPAAGPTEGDQTSTGAET
jgi:NADH-quinone oxidoreductase subunit H